MDYRLLLTVRYKPRGTHPPFTMLLIFAAFAFLLSAANLPSVFPAPAVWLPSGAQVLDKDDQLFWDKKFSDPKMGFSREPSRLLVNAIRGRKPGTAIDLGMGEGRNAIFLAQQGWQVTGVDLSDVAIAQAKAHAAKAGVKINAVLDGLDHCDLGRNQWDLIILFYTHAWYNGARRQSAQRMRDALKPGGLLVIEGFAGNEDYLFHPNELLRDFPELRVMFYEDTQGEAEWAPGRQSHVIRFVGEK